METRVLTVRKEIVNRMNPVKRRHAYTRAATEGKGAGKYSEK